MSLKEAIDSFLEGLNKAYHTAPEVQSQEFANISGEEKSKMVKQIIEADNKNTKVEIKVGDNQFEMMDFSSQLPDLNT